MASYANFPGPVSPPARGLRPAISFAPLLIVFMAMMVLPVSFDLAGLRLTPLRIMLLMSFIPLLWRILSDPTIRIRAADIFFLLFCLWLGVTILVNEGIARLPFVGISVIELLGGYLVGRVLVRSASDFKLFMSAYLLSLVFLFPFALLEFLTGRQLLADLLRMLGDVPYKPGSSSPRMGFERVITGFEHPILFGLYSSLAVVNSLYVWRQSLVGGMVRAAFAGFMAFMSLSSGAVLSVMIQLILVIWHKVLKGHWKLLLSLVALVYVFLELASNRGAILIFIETLTFSSNTGWARINQWEYGTAEVMRHPIFGMGLNEDWERPFWLSASIDNYWLLLAMRHGLPGVGFFAIGLALSIRWVVRAKNLPESMDQIRTGYMIGIVGMLFTLATVHVWGAVSVFVMFYLGAGAWLGDATRQDGEVPDGPDPVPAITRPNGPQFTRFPGHARASQSPMPPALPNPDR